MRIEDQVCEWKQGVRLNKLGVINDCLFMYETSNYYGEDNHAIVTSDRYDSEHADGGNKDHWKMDNDCGAFTVAELGVMLPEFIPSKSGRSLRLQQWSMGRRDTFSLQYREKADEIGDMDIPFMHDYPRRETEASARAAMLIYLLENNLTSHKEISDRLSKVKH